MSGNLPPGLTHGHPYFNPPEPPESVCLDCDACLGPQLPDECPECGSERVEIA